MIQTYTKESYTANYAGTRQYLAPFCGSGVWSDSNTYGINFGKLVVPFACTVKNFVITAPNTHPDFSVTIMKNGATTSMVASVTALGFTGRDTTHTVSFSQYDDISFRVDGPVLTSANSYSIGLYLEVDTAVNGLSFYGCTPQPGSIALNHGFLGGAFGNGIFETRDWSTGPIPLSNTYSISPITGNITGLATKCFADPGAGNWDAYIVKNQVLQDGTGGTVNTKCSITTGNLHASSSFTLPVVPTDHIDIGIIRTGASAPFSLAQITASVAVTSNVNNEYMFCGGNGDARAPVVYYWMGGIQLGVEDLLKAPVGPSGINITGLYSELTTAAGGASGGVGIDQYCRQNGSNTAAHTRIQDLATNAFISGLNIPFVDGDSINMIYVADPTATRPQYHWGLTANSASTPPPPPAGGGGIYQLVRGKTNDTVYTTTGTTTVAIVTPFIETALIGG